MKVQLVLALGQTSFARWFVATASVGNWLKLSLRTRQNDLAKALVFLLLFLVGCKGDGNTSIESQQGAPVLTADVETGSMIAFQSKEHEIAFCYPAGWAISESDQTIYLASSEAQLPWGFDYADSPIETYYIVDTMSPYLSQSDRRQQLRRSATEIAQAVSNSIMVSDELVGEFIKPVLSVNVNNKDAATFLVAVDDRYHYETVLRVTPDKVVIVAANGSATESDEMENIVNAIALSVHASQELSTSDCS